MLQESLAYAAAKLRDSSLAYAAAKLNKNALEHVDCAADGEMYAHMAHAHHAANFA
jgi:hypothetical protein